MKDRRAMDMTVGSPVRLIIMFAIPLFIGNHFQQIYSVVDIKIVGYELGDYIVSALGATCSVY